MNERTSKAEPKQSAIKQTDKRWTMPRLLGLVLIAVSVLLAWLLIVGFLGWRSGQQQLQDRQQADMNAQIMRQVELAESDVQNGNYGLATTRLEWVLAQRPDYRPATTLLVEMQSTVEVLQPPTPTPLVTAVPTAEPLPTVTPGPIESPSEELQRIQRLAATKNWEDAFQALRTFQQQFPNFERMQTDQLLYNVYTEYGLDLVNGNEVERGLFYLGQARRLGDLAQPVQDYILWAELYAQGMAFYGANWDSAAFYLRDLCLSAPFYQQSCSRLTEVLANRAVEYQVAGDFCPAEQLFIEASKHGTVPNLAEKLATLRSGCLEATPTPEGPITDTLSITNNLTAPLTFATPLAPPTPGVP
jgi:hypothetical protein